MPWWMWATAASLIWGIHYVMIGRVLTAVSPITVFWMPMIPLVLTLPFFYKTIVGDLHTLVGTGNDVKISAAVAMCTSILGALFLYKGIQASNATYASLIEITYPVFVAFFSFLIFRENHLNLTVVSGGILVMLGTSLVIYGNQ